MIKVIETVYDGYRFRSRLEARWYIFFRALGLKPEYEKEGFDLGEAGWYLPDFWLPELGCWVEIKPEAFTREERRRCDALGFATGRWVVMLSGMVGEEEMGGIGWWDFEEEGNGWDDDRAALHANHWALDWRGALCICSGLHSARRMVYYHPCERPDGADLGEWLREHGVRWPVKKMPAECRHDARAEARIRAAYSAARSARFEHGETP